MNTNLSDGNAPNVRESIRVVANNVSIGRFTGINMTTSSNNTLIGVAATAPSGMGLHYQCHSYRLQCFGDSLQRPTSGQWGQCGNRGMT